MEPFVAVFVFVANARWVAVLGGVLSVLALAAIAFVLAATAAERDSRALASVRWICVALAGILAAGGFLGLLARWAFAVACLEFLLAVLAFERRLRRHASTPRRDQNPLRRAVSRKRSQPSPGDAGRIASHCTGTMRRGRS